MSKLPDNKKLVLINIPSTHDSASYYMNSISGNFARTQYYPIKQQLELGIRRFDIRITKYNTKKEDEDIICCHGICDCYASNKFGDMKKLTYKSILLDIKDFLLKNPSEVVLMGTFLGRGNGQNLKRAYEIFIKTVGDISVEFNTKLTLGEARGKIINTTYLYEEVHKKRKIIRTRSKSVISGTGIDSIHKKYSKHEAYKIDGNLKVREMKDMFNKFNMTIEEAEIEEKINPTFFPLCYSISCTGEVDICLPNPIKEARIVHSFIQRDGVLKKGYYYGWINMDFANYESNYRFINTNFI